MYNDYSRTTMNQPSIVSFARGDVTGGYVLNTLGWLDNRFVLQNQYVAIFGY
ncbi:hypothetical protein [Bacillus salipaludis]|uniref:Uncharacterized protein n=1 Tax=Bacillus salipaludis TaxID=2547811 RepID=A0AA90TVV4_9BACI|nr:hypothetical protein [Bacillus salipaludis]MDQ6597823.1 hypothetical protein [Bacillus salipaludis]